MGWLITVEGGSPASLNRVSSKLMSETTRELFWVFAGLGLAAGSFACGPVRYEASPYAGQDGYAAQGTYQAAAAGTQVLYLPSPFPLQAITRVTVQADSGQVLVFGQHDVQQAAAGRLAVRLPQGISTGTVSVEAGGQVVSTPFHVEVSMTGQVTVGLGGRGGAACQQIAGRWFGNITSDPSARTTVQIEPLADCRTVHGFVHLESRSGSVDSTIEGTWDGYRLVAHDTQLFNVRPVPGAGFCATARYDLVLNGGTLQGTNQVHERRCAGSSPVYLTRN